MSILQCSAFFMVQLSHPYMTTGKTIALTIRTFVSKVMSLLFNILSRFLIVIIPRSKHLLISWLQGEMCISMLWGFPHGTVVKNLPAFAGNAENGGSTLGVKKIPWRRKWQPIPVLLPGKFHGWRASWATVNGVAKSQTRLSNFTFTFQNHCGW